MSKEIDKTLEEFIDYSNKIIRDINEDIRVKKHEIDELEKKKAYFFHTQSLVSKLSNSIPESLKKTFFDTFMLNKE